MRCLSIRGDGPHRFDIEYGATSSMTAVMGRMATYTGQVITWDAALASQENLSPEKYEWGPAPAVLVLDLDATDDPVHGEQEGRFFHGYYDGYCYLPLYIFCGSELLCA